MPRVINFGSINLDHVYQVPHFVRPGETLDSGDYTQGAGGKGFNQSIALARAGARVRHVGAVGRDGAWLKARLETEGVEVGAVRELDAATGHAIIQVAPSGENAIVLHGGANRRCRAEDVSAAITDCGAGDHFLTQNETSSGLETARLAKRRGLTVWFNPAPMTPEVTLAALESVDWLVLNETEGAALAASADPGTILARLSAALPHAHVVLTLGAAGVAYAAADERLMLRAPRVNVVDTTAAGDTFIGYLIATIASGEPPRHALERAVRAASLSVTRVGAADSIPFAREVALRGFEM